MHRRPAAWPAAADVCLRCQWRLAAQRGTSTAGAQVRSSTRAPARRTAQAAQRCFSTTRQRPVATSTASLPEVTDPAILDPTVPIRDRLKLWQEHHGGPDELELSAFERYGRRDAEFDNNVRSMAAKNDTSAATRASASQPSELDDYDEDDDLITVGMFLKPGDVVELDLAPSQLAVFTQQLGKADLQFITANGRWRHESLAQVRMVIQGCVDPSLLQPVMPYLPTKPDDSAYASGIQPPRGYVAPLTTVLDTLTAETERIYRENAAVLDNAWNALADKTRMRIMTLPQMARLLLPSPTKTHAPSSAELLAVRKALSHAQFRFSADSRSQRVSNIYLIRSTEDVAVIETVQGWMREYNEYRASLANARRKVLPRPTGAVAHVLDFAAKASRLINLSRKSRVPLGGGLGPGNHPNSPVVWDEAFSNTDQQIIRFLYLCAVSDSVLKTPGLHAAAASLLASTGCYDDEGTFFAQPALELLDDQKTLKRNKELVPLLLQEIGVLSPYHNRILDSETLMLPTIRVSRNVELLNAKAEAIRKNPNFRDSMARLRKDWDTLDVYCIDNADAQEIDDGVSISKVDGSPSEHWVHVHVANPTAFFDKTHVLSGLAAHMVETFYSPEKTFSMLPQWVSRDYFSLGPDRPVLTISVRVDAAGAILERQIQSGIVRRVTRLTYTELATLLGEEVTSSLHLTVGGSVPANKNASRPTPSLSPAQMQDLRDMHAVARKLSARRREAGFVPQPNRSLSYNLYPASSSPEIAADNSVFVPPSFDRARFINRDPIIDIALPAQSSAAANGNDFTAYSIVEEMMNLACSAAGRWCADRHIPVIFRGSVEPPHALYTSAQLEELVNAYLQKGEKEGKSPMETVKSMPLELMWRYNNTRRALTHSSPIRHDIIKAEEYVRLTSPLRRFADMLAHWQIEAVLRWEAATGRQFDGRDDESGSGGRVLPFSGKQIRESILSLGPREKMLKSAGRLAEKHWAFLALVRALYFGEGRLPELEHTKVDGLLEEDTAAGKGKRTMPILRVMVTDSQLKYTLMSTVVQARVLDWEVDAYVLPPKGGAISVEKEAENERSEGEGGEEGDGVRTVLVEGKKVPAHLVVRPFDEWECRIADINVYGRRLTLQGVRLVRRSGLVI